MPPFPAIRVISWLPKLRRPDGEALGAFWGEKRSRREEVASGEDEEKRL